MKVLFVLSFLLSCGNAVGQSGTSHDPTPIAVIAVAGGGVHRTFRAPLIAMYDDGEVIFWHNINHAYGYAHALLSPQELATIKHSLAAEAGPLKGSRFYRQGSCRDCRTTGIYLKFEHVSVAASIYGFRSEQSESKSSSSARAETDAARHAFQRIYLFLTNLQFPQEAEWAPDRVQVEFRKLSWGGTASQWPSDWPGLDSPGVMRAADQYTMFLPGTELPRLRKLIEAQPGMVVIDGKTGAAAFRYVFPGEQDWITALRITRR